MRYCEWSTATSCRNCNSQRGGRCWPSSTICATRASACPPSEPFDVADHNRARLDTDPPARAEVGQRLVDRLTRGADKLREFFLREVMRDVDAIAARLAEPLGQTEQGFRHS